MMDFRVRIFFIREFQVNHVFRRVQVVQHQSFLKGVLNSRVFCNLDKTLRCFTVFQSTFPVMNQPPILTFSRKTLVFKNTFMANTHKIHFLEIICEKDNNIGDQWFSEILKGIPLKHTPKPLPTGCKGLPFIKGFGGCETGVCCTFLWDWRPI